MGKLSITNRKGQKIVVILEKAQKQQGLAFVMHGLGGFKEQPHIATWADAFVAKGFTVVRFDTTNTIGESDGKYEDATVTNYYEDLADVIAWAKKQDWYQEPFYLVGHSLGGISVILYAEKYPEKVKGLAPIATVVSGKLSMQTDKYRLTAEEWIRTGWREIKHDNIVDKVTRLPWSHMEDRLQYDVLPQTEALTMPVLLIVGDKDDSTPLAHQQQLYDKLITKKELHVIKGAPHTFIEPEHLEEIKEIFEQWIDTVESDS